MWGILLDSPMTQFSFEWISSLNWLFQKWGQVQSSQALEKTPEVHKSAGVSLNSPSAQQKWLGTALLRCRFRRAPSTHGEWLAIEHYRNSRDGTMARWTKEGSGARGRPIRSR